MRIAFLGDSITEGCGATSLDKCYVNQVGQILGVEVLNYGVGGTRIAKQKETSEVAQWDYDFLSRAEIMEKDIDLVIVFGGTNDYGHGLAPLGSVDDINPFTFFGSFKSLLDYISNKYGKEKIGVITPLRRYEDEVSNVSNGVSLSTYVSIESYICNTYNIKYLDLFNKGIPKSKTNTGDIFTVDGLHPTDYGHRFIAEKISDFIKSNWLSNSTCEDRL